MKPKKIYVIGGIVIILAIVAIWGFARMNSKNKQTDKNQNSQTPPSQQELLDKLNKNMPSISDLQQDVGILRTSDNLAKGNLMLENATHVKKIYIKTSRDYSALLNRAVRVTFKSGISMDFALDNIVPLE